ncbi:MAG: adenylosuccinate lyase [Pseudomonadota bacterium]|nr:adenylosuccinate lyase [Pseudomonadota bacterium]
MIERYTREEMSEIWATESRFAKMLEVEKAVAEVQAELGIIPKEAALAIKQKSKFSIKRILEIEKKTKHDVIAFINSVAESVGPFGKFVHFGMTSSDVLDTALSLQIRDAEKVLLSSLNKLKSALHQKIKKHKFTFCAGRTHGMHAEPTTFGLKMAGFLAELKRNEIRIRSAIANILICKLSGAVGTYSNQPIEVEEKVSERLGLKPEFIATQVIPRDRHAEVILSLSLLGAGLERLATELRHLQRTEVGEVVEGFSKGQKGSSAMPHKKNPISAENITGIARLLRSYAGPALENIVLWHERDISHSAVERVVFPDAFILADYALMRMSDLIEGLFVNEARMKANMNSSQGQLFSSQVLTALIKSGLPRDEAYGLIQEVSHKLKANEKLQDKLLAHRKIHQLLSKKAIYDIFSGEQYKKSIGKMLGRLTKDQMS